MAWPQETLTTFNDDPDLLKKVITGDESCICDYDIVTKVDMEMKEKPKEKLLTIPKSALQKCFEDWKKRWHKCIISKGGYFEGDKIVIDN